MSQKAGDVLSLHTLHANAGAPAPRLSQPSEDRRGARARARQARDPRSIIARALPPSRHPRKRIGRCRPASGFVLVGDVVKKILERLEQERTETPATLIRLPQPVSFQNHQEKILREVLRVLGRIAAAADVGKNGAPVSSAKLR